MVFGNGVKNIQAAAYNGVRTVFNCATTYRCRKMCGMCMRVWSKFFLPEQFAKILHFLA